MRKISVLLLSLVITIPLFAREGMWIPLLLDKYNIEEMQQMGFRLTAEDIYSINQAAMKDAVMIFGGGCTGELISDQGLLITNHHCGFSSIQSHSSVEHDYLTDGFWAMSPDEELPNPGLSVTFLKRMEDVTDSVLTGTSESMTMKERGVIISRNIKRLISRSVDGTHYTAQIKPFFQGNQYFLFVNEVFKDVRLVGAPPSAIGKFGGDTDNWMWPRHTGDFSLFRIYANEENEPAEYSPGNKPYRAVAHFPVSLKGIEEGDFTMVFGYPGSTDQYVPSFHIEMLTQKVYPKLIDVRTHKLNVLNRYMETNAAVRIQYASKKASISNSWKRWQGEIRGLEILNAVEKKRAYEAGFINWVESNAGREARLGTIIKEYDQLYQTYGDVQLARDLMLEVLVRNGIETNRLAALFNRLITLYQADEVDDGELEQVKKATADGVKLFFKDYHQPIDREVTGELLALYLEYAPDDYVPAFYADVNGKHKGDTQVYADRLFKKTFFTDEDEVLGMVNNFSKKQVKKIKRDPMFRLYESFMEIYSDNIGPDYARQGQKLDSLNRIYMEAQMAYEPEKVFYPDANFTLRVTYGEVDGYRARDAVKYLNHTTLEGIMQKDNPDIYDYRVPERLKELYRDKDYGRYGENGTMPVCFIATNHTTGGNSGSPVVNAQGHLIGVNFDRAWEGVMSDLMYNPDQCRNISIDIRYALFIIDKFAGAGYLLDEMTIVE